MSILTFWILTPILQIMIQKCDPEFRYKHVETALVDVTRVQPEALGAFRGRIRHLRNIGLPELPDSGSGKHIAYSRRQALEMLIAIQLENIGHKPDCAAKLSQSVVRQSPHGQHKRKDCYIIPSAPSQSLVQYNIMYGIAALSRFMESGSEVFTVINISALVRRLDVALDRSLKRV
jgi:hypothetical protein